MSETTPRRRRPRKGAHVVMGPGDNQVTCSHCGNVLTFPVPIDVRVFCALTKAYVKVHAGCVKKGTAAPAVPERPPGATRVRLLHDVHGDWPIGHATVAPAGEYEVHVNPHGAVSVAATDGRLLGVKPGEFEWIAPAAEQEARR